MTNTFNLFIPLTKVDAKKREVWGRATQEVIDGHDEIMDYETSVPNFKIWSGDAVKRSKGKSKGNIRAMHQPIAAGKLIDIDFNDAEKAVDIGTYISDDQEWQKCLDGTYTGFSIGGDYAKRWSDATKPGVIRYTAMPHEISLVDAPAVPTATFELVKADGSSELRKFANVMPIAVGEELEKADVTTEEVEKAVAVVDGIEEKVTETPVQKVELQLADGVAVIDTSELEKDHPGAPGIPTKDVEIESGVTEGALLTTQPVPEEVLTGEKAVNINEKGDGIPATLNTDRVHTVDVKKTSTLEDIEALLKEMDVKILALSKNIDATDDAAVIEKKLDNELGAENNELTKSKVIAELELRGSRVGIARREGEPTTAPSNYSDNWMQYADPANWRWALNKREHIEPTLMAYNQGAGKSKYSPSEWNVLGRRITRLASEISGENYQYNPALKKVAVKEQEKTMSDLSKADDKRTAGVLRDLSAQVNAACQMIGSDPEAAKDMLTRALAAIDETSVVSSAKPGTPKAPVDGDEGTKEVAKSVVAEEEVTKAKSTKPADKKAPKMVEVPASEAEETELEVTKAEDDNEVAKAEVDEPEVAKADAEPEAVEKVAFTDEVAKMFAKQNDLIASMQEALAKMAEAQNAQPATYTPFGDLSALVNNSGAVEETDLLKAMNEGDLAKAFATVNNDPNKLYEQVNELAVRQLHKTGINVGKFGVLSFPE